MIKKNILKRTDNDKRKWAKFSIECPTGICPTGICKGMYTGIYTGKYKYLVNTGVLLIKFAMLIIDHHKRYP